jgi:hypothetical protein
MSGGASWADIANASTLAAFGRQPAVVGMVQRSVICWRERKTAKLRLYRRDIPTMARRLRSPFGAGYYCGRVTGWDGSQGVIAKAVAMSGSFR